MTATTPPNEAPNSRPLRARRAIAITLAWLIVATVAILIPANSSTDTATTPWTTQTSRAEIGERLSIATPVATGVAARSQLLDVNCEEHDDASICGDTWAPPVARERIDQPGPELRARVSARSLSRLPTPRWRIWPDHEDNQVVNLNTILRVTSSWRTVHWRIWILFGADIHVTAIPLQSIWDFTETNTGRRETVRCWGPGIPWVWTMTSSYCDKEWDHSSDVTGDVHMAMRVRYLVIFTGGFNFITTWDKHSPDQAMLKVAEIQGRGRSDELPVVTLVDLPDPVDDDDDGGGLCSLWGIRFICEVGGEIAEATLEFILDRAPWLREIYRFLEGCGDAVLEQLGGIVDILQTIWDAVQDPGEAFDETVQMLQDLWEAATGDPEKFFREVLSEFADLDYYEAEGGAAWAGKMVCNIAIDILTGKASARLIEKVSDFVRRGPDGPDGPDRPDRPNPDPDCVLSSFPGDTPVLLADGAWREIRHVRPGDQVASYDRDEAIWEPGLVIDQWSHHDQGPAATADLANGGSITATADHLFYLPEHDGWQEIQHLSPGDELLSPGGLVTVDHVTVGPHNPWIVWELTVADNENFAVRAGDTAVLVHNCLNPAQRSKADDVIERLANDGLDISPEELGDAWQRYLRDNPDADFDSWLNQYENIRRNNFLGNAHEMNILDEHYGISNKNGQTYPDPNGGAPFKPDAVISERPPHFVEVKDYQNTVLYPGSNAGKALNHLIEEANAGNPGRFDLHITDPNNISPRMQDLIDEARDAGVDVRINPAPPG